MQNVILTSEGQKVQALLHAPKTSNNKAILFLHGWRSDKEAQLNFAARLSDEGYNSLTFDFRGMGESEGDINTLTRENYLEDCLIAYDFLASRPGITKVSAVGASFGGYMTALLTKYRPLHNVALRAPANYPDEDFGQPQVVHSTPLDTKGWEPDINQRTATFAVRAMGQFAGNILIVKSSNDTVVHPATVQTYLDACKNKSKVVVKTLEGAPHSISKNRRFSDEYIRLLITWFKNT